MKVRDLEWWIVRTRSGLIILMGISSESGKEEIVWYPKSLKFASFHPAKKQWAGVQRYDLHHFRIGGGNNFVRK